ncbi:unnamed protein product [Mytilus edulis]|uniref:WSC domain-containing protein n=1 Tax=Mytilus edulis TaxID=6550 RepID=A0A8S3VBF5_MYTED|nr:unnamed protein product [Mytilus edulis]
MPLKFGKSIVALKLVCLLMCAYSVESAKLNILNSVEVIRHPYNLKERSNEYVGCFIDEITRLFPHEYLLNDGTIPPDMENNRCLLYCKEQGYMYSGTQNTEECWCGDDPYQYGLADVSDCNKQCIGDSQQICGDGWRLSVYETGYLPFKKGKLQYKIVSNDTILTSLANQVLSPRSEIECALYCKISGNCKVFVISTETGQCSLYNSYTVMCEGVQHEQSFQVYMMK